MGAIDPQLLNLLYRLRTTLGVRSPIQVIRASCNSFTNERLARPARAAWPSVACTWMERPSIRLPGVALADLRDAAISLHAGSVGFYSRENFVHVDTGSVRTWGR